MGHSYRDLIVWQKSRHFVKDVYLASQAFPKEERFGLTAQIRRAAVSVPSNIAEGQGRSFDREFSLFISHALGSLMEVETQLLIAQDLGYLTAESVDQLLKQSAEIGRLANGLLTTLKKSTSAGRN
jgi:four helix bundle protein